MFNKIAILLFIVPAIVTASPLSTCKFHAKLCRLIRWLLFLFTFFFSGDGLRAPLNVTMEGCDEISCKFRSLKAISVKVDFNAETPARSLLSSTDVFLGDSWVTVQRDRLLCPQLIIGRCPVNVGDKITFRANTSAGHLPVGRKGKLRYHVYNEKTEPILCIQAKFVSVA